MILPQGAPPALAQVAQRYFDTSRGVVSFQLHRVFDVHGGFSRRHEDLVMNGVYDDGTLVRVRVVSYTIDGRPASASDVAGIEQSWNHPNPEDVFAAPYDERNFGAYRYTRGGPSTIYFDSNVHDAGHGRGSFTYDAQGDVLGITYQPNALPPHASSGEITDVRSAVLPGYWAPIQETQQYHGRYGPFAAAGAIQVSYSGFRRYADLESALRAF
jgi:hypothetical protein